MDDNRLRRFFARDGVAVYWKAIYGVPPRKNVGEKKLGIAYRTARKPLLYLPLWHPKDFDYDGEVGPSWEWIRGTFLFHAKTMESPVHFFLHRTLKDPHFCGERSVDDTRVGNEKRSGFVARSEMLDDISRDVLKDVNQGIVREAGDTFVSLVLQLLGPTFPVPIKGAFGFIVSQAIDADIERRIKDGTGLTTLPRVQR